MDQTTYHQPPATGHQPAGHQLAAHQSPTTDNHPLAATVTVRATATPGLLARLAAVLNPHPVTGFDFAEAPGGSVTVTVCVGESGSSRWHAERVVARLRRVIGVTTVSLSPR